MTWTLAKGTGAPLTEQRMASSRQGFADYVEPTSGFVPGPPEEGHDERREAPQRRALREPSSQTACSVGGRVLEQAAGAVRVDRDAGAHRRGER